MFKCLDLNKKLIQNVIFVRYKHKENHWSMQNKKKRASHKAMEHFDDFYKQVYEAKWPLMKSALLSKPKYVAVLNNYSDSDEMKTMLENRGGLNVRRLFQLQREQSKETAAKEKRRRFVEAVVESERTEAVAPEKSDFSLERGLKNAELDESRIVDSKASGGTMYEFVPATKIKGREDFVHESTYFKYYEKGKDFPVAIDKEYDLHFPEYLNAYCFEEENNSNFPPPIKGSTGVLNYYLMDGGSLLPVLALDLKPENTFLDLCSAPGGKSLLAVQTLYPSAVVCNDVSVSRTNRIFQVFKQYLYDFDQNWLQTGKIRISCSDGRYFKDELYDRILVDVPCTTDRHSLKEDENNIFRADRIKERLKLPELQSELLYNALQLVKIGGIVVYSTCSLSPIQNDGVVHMALKKLWEDTKMEVVVKDLSPVMHQAKNVYKMAGPKLTRYGNLVLPHVGQNYGPTYFCKLQRVT